MMNIPPSEADRLSLRKYEGLLWNWNESHGLGDDIEPPDADRTMKLINIAKADPRLVN